MGFLGGASGKKKKKKNFPAKAGDGEMQVRSLGQDNPLEESMATHSSILAWRIPWTEEPGGYSPWGRKELDTTEATEYICYLQDPLHL